MGRPAELVFAPHVALPVSGGMANCPRLKKVGTCASGVSRLHVHNRASAEARGYPGLITRSFRQSHALFEQRQSGVRISLVNVKGALI